MQVMWAAAARRGPNRVLPSHPGGVGPPLPTFRVTMHPMSWRRAHWLALGAVLAILAAARVPALTGPPNLSQDATEYVDIARNVAAGEGLTLKIRGYFFGDGLSIPYPAESLRRPLFPALMATAYALTRSDAVFRWFNFGMFLVNAALLGLLLRRALPPWVALYSLLLAGLTEPMFLTSIFPWAEQTAFMGLLVALVFAGRAAEQPPGAPAGFGAGVVCALAALSRPEYLLVGLLFAAWLLVLRSRRATLLLFAFGFLAPLITLSAANYRFYGRTFLPGDYLFHSRAYSAYFSWDTAAPDGALGFLAGNWLWIAGRIGLNFVNYAAKLFGWKNLFVLGAVLPLALRAVARGSCGWRGRHLAYTGAAFLCAYSLVWAGMDRERYLLAVTSFWLPLCVWEAARLTREASSRWARRAWVTALAAGLPFLAANAIHAGLAIQRRDRPGERFYASHNPAWDNASMAGLAAWIRANVGDDDVLCLENPFLVNYLTGRAALVLPEQTHPGEFIRFLSEYNVRYWVNNTVDTKRPVALLDALRQAAFTAGFTEVAHCGTYEVWRVPRTGARITE